MLELPLEKVSYLIKKYGAEIPFLVLNEVSIPEADILICKYKNYDINIKDDLAYGIEIEFIKEYDENVKNNIVEIINTWEKVEKP